MHGRQTSYTNGTFNSLQFAGFLNERVIFYDFFCATQVVWMYIYAYGGEWVNELNETDAYHYSHQKHDIDKFVYICIYH